MQLSKKQKVFPQLSSAFMKFAWNFENFEKDMVLTAYVFPKTEPG